MREGAGLTCSAGCTAPRRCGPSLQLCVTDAEMLTPGFGELQVRTACQGLNEAQHNAAKRIGNRTPFAFPFTHSAVSIHQHSKCCAGRSCQFEVRPRGAVPVGCRIIRCSERLTGGVWSLFSVWSGVASFFRGLEKKLNAEKQYFLVLQKHFCATKCQIVHVQ